MTCNLTLYGNFVNHAAQTVQVFKQNILISELIYSFYFNKLSLSDEKDDHHLNLQCFISRWQQSEM